MTKKPTIHLIGCFHTIIDLQHTHCAFSQKVLRFPKMMQPCGYTVIEYSNGTSESTANEHVQILTKEELELLSSCWLAARDVVPQTKTLFGDALHMERASVSADLAAKAHHPIETKVQFHGDTAAIGSPHWTEFNKRLIVELKKRVQPGDIIAHPFGRSHTELLKVFPVREYAHVETGIGYPDAPFGAFRIFETYNWQSWHHGRHNSAANDYEWVIPNYYDLSDWTPPCRQEHRLPALLRPRVLGKRDGPCRSHRGGAQRRGLGCRPGRCHPVDQQDAVFEGAGAEEGPRA